MKAGHADILRYWPVRPAALKAVAPDWNSVLSNGRNPLETLRRFCSVLQLSPCNHAKQSSLLRCGISVVLTARFYVSIES
jgi:hypothetical protein